jgi:hypothetical protein
VKGGREEAEGVVSGAVGKVENWKKGKQWYFGGRAMLLLCL